MEEQQTQEQTPTTQEEPQQDIKLNWFQRKFIKRTTKKAQKKLKQLQEATLDEQATQEYKKKLIKNIIELQNELNITEEDENGEEQPITEADLTNKNIQELITIYDLCLQEMEGLI